MKEIGLKIKKARLAKGLKQEELAERVGAKSSATVSAWEVGKAKPDCITLLRICEVLDTTPNELLSFSSDAPTQEEQLFLGKYRMLDSFGKKAIDSLLDIEYDRILSTPIAKAKKRMIKLDLYNYPASAGVGNFLEELSPENIFVVDSNDSKLADYVLPVSGNSMEPTYHDGDYVLIQKCDTVAVGEAGIFIVNGDAYIKELGEGCLISHNKAYSPIRLSESDSVYCCGRVIGIAEK